MDRYAAERILRRLPANVSVIPTRVEQTTMTNGELVGALDKQRTITGKLDVMYRWASSEHGAFANGVAEDSSSLKAHWERERERAEKQEAA